MVALSIVLQLDTQRATASISAITTVCLTTGLEDQIRIAPFAGGKSQTVCYGPRRMWRCKLAMSRVTVNLAFCAATKDRRELLGTFRHQVAEIASADSGKKESCTTRGYLSRRGEIHVAANGVAVQFSFYGNAKITMGLTIGRNPLQRYFHNANNNVDSDRNDSLSHGAL